MSKSQTLRLATTTSTADSGLLDFILPDFEKANNCKVDMIAVGSGQALEIGRKGDADVLLVHSRKAEDQFVADGHARERFDVMYNDYIIVGPKDDPAKVTGKTLAKDTFKAIMDAQAPFVSRGDKSGTNTQELSVWASLNITPTGEMKWYNSIGQGMGETLLFANERKGYTLTDRGTYLSMKDKLPDLVIVVGGNNLAENKDRDLLNPYGVIAVNPDKHPSVNYELAMKFVTWLTSPETQKKIGGFGVDKFGQPLFYPDSDEYKATREITVKIGDKSQTFTLADLQAFPKTTLADYQAVGVKKGPLGMNTWTGASLKEVLLKVDPTLADATNSGKRIVLTSSDGWQATIKWAELFGTPKGGEALYDVKGCNECHGVNGEGTSPKGKIPAPPLAGKEWSFNIVKTVLRTGKDAHGGVNPYTEAQLSDADLQLMLDWFKDPKAPAKGYTVDAAKLVTLLAYEKNGKPMTGKDGRIQLIVGMDEFAGRYSHWVKTIEVK
jgi:tungstate transport system substrate-binding protein